MPRILFVWLVLVGVADQGMAAALQPGDMVRLGPGAFIMGTDPAEIPALMARFGVSRAELFTGEVPGHRVEVAAFEMDRFEVTNAQFAAFTRAHPQWQRAHVPPDSHNGRYLAHWTDGGPSPETLDHPVTFITWQAAQAFCSHAGKRLPAETEWEYAARGGRSGDVFPWGDEEPDSTRVNWSGSGFGSPVAVGSYPPNPYGLFDVAGNVWEFVADAWSPYLTRPPAHPTRRIIRGGSWGAAAINLRVRYRDSHPEAGAGDHVGFRCARDAQESTPQDSPP